MFVSREDEVRVWRGCKPEGLKRRLVGGLGEAEARPARRRFKSCDMRDCSPASFVVARTRTYEYMNTTQIHPIHAEPVPIAHKDD